MKPDRCHSDLMKAMLLATSALLGCSVEAASEISIGSAAGDVAALTPVPVVYSSDVPCVGVQFEVLFYSSLLVSAPALAADPASGLHVVSSEPAPGIRRVVVYSDNNRVLLNGPLVNLPFSPRAGVAENTTTPLTAANPLASSPDGQSIGLVTLLGGTFTVGVPARFKSVSVSPTGEVELLLGGPAGRSYILQGSGDLKEWTALQTGTVPSGGTLRFLDSPALSVNARYYRALQQ